MLIRNMLLKYYAPESGGEGSGGSGIEITPEIQKLIDERVTSEVTGLKSKNSELLGTIKQQKENLSRFDGIDPDAVRGILQRFSDDEEAKLIAAGKIDEVLDKRTERLRADVDKQIKAANERAEKLKRSPTNSGIGFSGMQSVQQPPKRARCLKLLTILFCVPKAHSSSTTKARP